MIGEMLAGSVLYLSGWRIGEVKSGHLKVAICASASTISFQCGHRTLGDRFSGLLWMYSGVLPMMKAPYASGKQSRSKTKACSNWPWARAKTSQLPNHDGRVSLTKAVWEMDL